MQTYTACHLVSTLGQSHLLIENETVLGCIGSPVFHEDFTARTHIVVGHYLEVTTILVVIPTIGSNTPCTIPERRHVRIDEQEGEVELCASSRICISHIGHRGVLEVCVSLVDGSGCGQVAFVRGGCLKSCVCSTDEFCIVNSKEGGYIALEFRKFSIRSCSCLSCSKYSLQVSDGCFVLGCCGVCARVV